MVPFKQFNKLRDLGLNTQLNTQHKWVLLFLGQLCVHISNSIVKFADDTKVLDLISNNDELTYRKEVKNYKVVPS